MKCPYCAGIITPYRTGYSDDLDDLECLKKQHAAEITELKNQFAAANAKKENSFIQKLKKIRYYHVLAFLLLITLTYMIFMRYIRPKQFDYCYIQGTENPNMFALYIHNPGWFDDRIILNSNIFFLEEYAKKYNCEMKIK